ncbi:MAG: hypothetical protein RLZZ628_3325 [Bacteroidota bacterium]|jgi:hypothetical protein
MINKIEKKELEDIFLDVRKAYRLLFLYQQRVLSSIKYIKQKLKLNKPSGSAYASFPIRQGKGELDNWAWDWLAMYHYEFYFGAVQNTSTHLAIWIISDSGLFEKHNISNGFDGRVLEIKNYAAPEESDTLVVFYASSDKTKLRYNQVSDFKTKNFRKNSVYVPYLQTNSAGEKFLSMSFPMSEFIDEEGILKIVKTFVEKCKENGIEGIEIKTEEVKPT